MTQFYRGIVPDRDLEPPEDKPVCRCPRCGREIYAGTDVFVDRETFEVLGCRKCVKTWEVEEE